MKERPQLNHELLTWLDDVCRSDPLQGFRARYDILSDSHRENLVRALPSSITSTNSIVDLLSETDEWASEWAGPLLALILQFNKKCKSDKENNNEETRSNKRPRIAQEGGLLPFVDHVNVV